MACRLGIFSRSPLACRDWDEAERLEGGGGAEVAADMVWGTEDGSRCTSSGRARARPRP
jgi:hypothetical protein